MSPTTAVITDLGAYGLRVSVTVALDVWPDEVVASWPVLGAHGTGGDTAEALRALKASVCVLWDDVRDEEVANLGPGPRKWKRVLSAIIVHEPKPTPNP